MGGLNQHHGDHGGLKHVAWVDEPVDCFDHALPQALLHGHGENSLVKVATGRYGSFVVEPWPAAFCRGILEAAWSLDTLVGAPVSTYY
jgi:hypothetical protein